MWSEEGLGGLGATNGFYTVQPNALNSPAGKSKQGVRRHQNIVPVVVRQIRDCKEEEFKLFDMDVQVVVIVGVLREYEVTSTKVTYKIEDHTGKISAVLWLENDGSTAPALPAVKEGSYVRVFGSLRNVGGQRSLMVLKIFPVDDINIPTNHLLQVIYARLEAENLSKNPELTQIQANNPGAELANSMSFMNSDIATPLTVGQMGFTAVQEKVFNILKADKSPAGLTRGAILQQFPPNQHRDVRNAIEFLATEGHAYSTIDNEHFKHTDNN